MGARRRSKKTGAETCFLDANVPMYAAGAEHPLRRPCRAALARAVDRGVRLVTDAEVLQEILYRYFSIGRPDAARVVHRSTVRICDAVLPVTEAHTARALALLIDNPRLSPRDAIHVATVESLGEPRILSTDKDFDAIVTVRRIDPADF